VPTFGSLLAQQIPRLRRYARALTRDPSRADDVVQDCLCRALRKQHLFQPGTDLRAWLFTMLHNQYVNSVRRAVREGPVVPVDEMANTIAETPRQSGPLMLRDLDRALATLSEDQRQVVLLVGLEGFAYDQVAKILEIPTGTVRSRLSRAREALRQMLDRPAPAHLAAGDEVQQEETLSSAA
jgi:RNA polymerase sigma-70 factor, ECF subfamily